MAHLDTNLLRPESRSPQVFCLLEWALKSVFNALTAVQRQPSSSSGILFFRAALSL